MRELFAVGEAMPYLDVGGVRLYYDVVGSGEPVVLVNGIFMSTRSWVYQANHLASLGYMVVTHDLRGQWMSDKPIEEDLYSVEIHAEDLRKLLDHLGLRRAHLVGTSYGGMISMLFAVKYREYVNDLTIITSTSEIHEDLRLTALRWLEGALSGDFRKFVLSWINDVYSGEYLTTAGPTFVDKLIGYFSQGFDLQAAVKLLKAFLRVLDSPLTPLITKIEVPTLVVAAELDRVMPPKYSRIISRSIRGSTYFEVREAGHAVIIEKPDIVNCIVTGFIRSNSLSSNP